jgi:hypothetical protein
LDKYESKLRIEEIEKLKKKRQYKEAARLADTIEWYRIKNAVTLYKIADLYKICRNYTKCRELLELAYERSPYAKNVIFALCDVCLEFGDFEPATEYYKEYVSLAPNDSGVWILKYKMLKALDAGIDEQIGILETLKRKDRIEEWEFELATLYHRAGLAEKCVEECDEIILWFGEGSYVYKAMELKMLHEPLTPEQQDVYNHRQQRKAELAARKEASLEKRQTGKMGTGKMGTGRMQTGKMKKVRLDSDEQATRRMETPVRTEAPEVNEEEEFHVKTINMGQFNTIDLQAELAANVQGYIGGEPSMVNRVSLDDSYLQGYPTEISENLPVVEESAPFEPVQEEIAEPVIEESVNKQEVLSNTIPADAKEVFFEDSTQDMRYRVSLPEKPKADDSKLKAFKERYSKEMEGKPLPEGMGRLSGEEEIVDFDSTTPIAGGIVEERVLEDGTVELIKQFNDDYEPEVVKVGKERRQERPRREDRPAKRHAERTVEDEQILDPDYVNMLPTTEDKQISGQLNITDILAGWEEKKKEQERSFQEELRKKTLENTGNLFADFDKEANSGLLATLDNPALINSVTDSSSPQDFIKGISVEDMKKGKKPVRPNTGEIVFEELKVSKVIEVPYEEPEEEAEEVIEEVKETVEETTDVVEEAAKESVEEAAAAAEEAKEEVAEAVEETVEEVKEAEPEVDSDEKMIQDILDEDEKEAKAAKAEPESLYYGSVTANISGNIWDEVDNVEPVATVEETAEEAAEEVAGEAAEEVANATAAVEAAKVGAETGVVTAAAATAAAVEESAKEAAVPEGETKVLPKIDFSKKKKKKDALSEVSEEKKEDVPEVDAEEAVKEGIEELEDDEAGDAEEKSGVKGDDLSKDAKKFFSPFLYSKKMKQQIMDAVENISLAAYTGNLIITADSSESSAKLATIFYQYLKASDPNFTGKAAKIGAEKLNKKDMNEIFSKLAGGSLIVSHAGKMTNSTINAILQNLNQDARGVEVILHDTRPEIRRLLERAAVLERFFNCRVDIIAVSAEMLAEYGKKYAEEKGYSIDDLAMLAFSGRISELQIGTHMVSVDEVKEIVDGAIEHVNKPTLSKAFSTMTGKRFDEDHRVVLKEKDFEFRK